MSLKTTLVIIYNHNYEPNIEKLEKMYGDKFDKIYHLMPFYRGNKPNVAKIYGTSYQFQDYVRQGLSVFKNDESTHYCFMGDDVLLNPEFNQYNITQKLNLDVDSGFIPALNPVGYETFFYWDWAFTSVRAMECNFGCEYQKFLPSINEAMDKFTQKNIPNKNITKEGFLQIQKHFDKLDSNYCKYYFKGIEPPKKGLFKKLKYKIRKQMFLKDDSKFKTFNDSPLPYYFPPVKKFFDEYLLAKSLKNDTQNWIYPLTFAFSDFFVIPSKKIDEFAHLCGVFAGANVFVECAIPTSMVLCLDKIVYEKDINYKMFIFGEEQAYKRFCIENEYSLKKLYDNWGEKSFIHAVKLSQWR